METALKLFVTITGNRQQNSTLLQNVFYRKSFAVNFVCNF